MCGVGVEGTSESLGLMVVDLIRMVEDVVQFRVLLKDGLVELARNRCAMFLKDRNSGLDDLDLLWCEWHCIEDV